MHDPSESSTYNRNLIEAALDPLVTIGPDGKITDVNMATEKITGLPREKLIGTDFSGYFTDPHLAKIGYEKVFKDGVVRDYPLEIKRKGGFTPVLYNATVYKDEKGKVAGVFAAARDITDRLAYEKNLERTLRALKTISKCNEILVRVTDENELLRDICQTIVDIGGYRMAWVGYAENDKNKTVRPIQMAGFEKGYLEKAKIVWSDTERGRGPTGIAIREGKVVIEHDIQNDPKFAPWRKDAIERGYRSSIALPIVINGVVGALMVYAVEPNAFGKEEVSLLGELCNDLAYGIRSIRSDNSRRLMEEEVKKSEKRYRQTLDAMLEGCMIIGFDWKYIYVNNMAARHGHQKREKLIGKTILEMYPGVEKSEIFKRYKKCMDDRKPQSFESSYTFPDGVTEWYEFSVQPAPEGIFVLSIDISKRKLTEKELLERTEELQKMNNLMVGRELRMIELKKKIKELESVT